MTVSVQKRSRAGGATDLRSHHQRAIEYVAADILGRHIDDRIMTISEYQDRIGVGSGTVQ